MSIFLLTPKWKWLLWSNLSYVVIYLVNWRKVASKKPFSFWSWQKKLKKQFLLRKNTYFWKRCSFGSQFFYELIPNLLRHPVYNTFIVINIFIFNVDVNLHCIGVVSVTYMTWPKAMFKKKWRTQWKRIEYDVLTSKSFSINVCLEALVYSVITLLHAPSHLLCTLCSCTIQNPVYTVCAHMFMLEIQRMKDLPNSIYRDFLQKVLSYSLLNHTWRYIFETYIYPFFSFLSFFPLLRLLMKVQFSR